MSIFNNDGTPTIDLDSITLDTLVGEGQKYKTPDELAKAYANADAYIAQMKAELAEAKTESKVLKEIYDAQKKTPDGTPKQETLPADPPLDQKKESSEDDKDFGSLFKEEYEKLNKETSRATNINVVSEKLSQFYGSESKARQAVQDKAKAMGVGPEWLMDMAGASPSALYTVLGLDQRSFSTPTVDGDVNTSAFNQDRSRRGFRHYEEIRKTNRKAYYSREIQKQMLEDARKQGDAFYT